MSVQIETKNKAQTQKVGRLLAQSILESRVRGPFILALRGELGSGKTAFAQGFAKGMGIRGSIRSPTFVLMKTYPLSVSKLQAPSSKFQLLVHADCYRLEKPQELVRIGFREVLKDPSAIVLIEWADRVKKLIPASALWIRFEHGRKPNERLLTIELGIRN